MWVATLSIVSLRFQEDSVQRISHMIGGASMAVASPFKQMARLAAAPGRRPSCRARAVPMPWEEAPMARP